MDILIYKYCQPSFHPGFPSTQSIQTHGSEQLASKCLDPWQTVEKNTLFSSAIILWGSKFDIEQFLFCDCWLLSKNGLFNCTNQLKKILGEKLDYLKKNLEIRLLIKMLRCIRPFPRLKYEL